MYLENNGHSLYLRSRGPEDGPTLILLHHGLGAVRSWRKQIRVLAGAGYRVIAYDRWGYGKSDRRDFLDIPRFEADQDDLEVVMDAFGIEKAALIGHSDGGTIALYFAIRQPARVSGLVTVAAHVHLEERMKDGILQLRQDYQEDADFKARLNRVHGPKAASVFDNWFTGWMKEGNLGWDMRPSLANISCPALVIQGDEDEHATPEHARQIAAAISAAELWLLAGAGHLLPQDFHDEFNRVVLAFLLRKGIANYVQQSADRQPG
jgi:pimeloyl-ACP methyl ester carboxylesterase